ncbi:MAG TPA: hypothetical protein VIW28_09110, partial [Gemmatimonadales bacterium]
GVPATHRAPAQEKTLSTRDDEQTTIRQPIDAEWKVKLGADYDSRLPSLLLNFRSRNLTGGLLAHEGDRA